MWKKRIVYRVSVRKTERKKSLGRPSRRWHYNTKILIKETSRINANLFNVAQKREKLQAVKNTVRDFSGFQNFGQFIGEMKKY